MLLAGAGSPTHKASTHSSASSPRQHDSAPSSARKLDGVSEERASSPRSSKGMLKYPPPQIDLEQSPARTEPSVERKRKVAALGTSPDSEYADQGRARQINPRVSDFWRSSQRVVVMHGNFTPK